MGLIAPPTYVAPPALEPLRFGLYSVSNMPTPTGRWDLGIEYEQLAGGRAALRPSSCVDEYSTQVELRQGETTREGIPFVVVGSYECGSASRPIEEAEERARLHLAAGEERAVEFAIATGVMGNAPTFQGATDLTPVPGTPVTIEHAIALIESAQSATYASVGAIHAPRRVAALADDAGIVARYGQHLETLIGTYVAFGGGYDLANVGPTGQPPAAGGTWVYGTGRPTIRRGEVFTQPDDEHYLDRDSNIVAIMAQRTVVVTWDVEVSFAVLVNSAVA